MIYKSTHFIGWNFYKTSREHTYCLGCEDTLNPSRNFYLYPKASIHDGVFYEDRLSLGSRYSSCTSSWYKRNFLSRETMKPCSWWKIKTRAPKDLVQFFEVELERIFFCNCFPTTMRRGNGSPFQFCDPLHLRNVDRKFSLLVEN